MCFFYSSYNFIINSKLKIKNVNINPTRDQVLLKYFKMMGVKINLKNIKIYKGEKIADIYVKSVKSIKSIKCPSKLNSSAIDEFLIIFLVAAKAKEFLTLKIYLN